MTRKKAATAGGLGKALVKSKQKKPNLVVDGEGPQGGFKVHTTVEVNTASKKPVSILEQSSLEEFAQLAQLSSKQFEAERGYTVISGNQMVPVGHNQMIGNFVGGAQNGQAQYTPLTIPRRPTWEKGMTNHEIDNNEKQAFLQWRADIASREQNNVSLAITPFEKNIDIWRQLWRVIERSHLLLQIVDGRNPYFFYSADLEKYIEEVSGDKHFILLINKADYLSEEIIAHWNQFFKEKGVAHIFFSALAEQEKLDGVPEEVSDDEGEDQDSDEEDEADGEDKDKEETKQQQQTPEPTGAFTRDLVKQIEEEAEAEQNQKLDVTVEEELQFDTPEVFSRNQLLSLLKQKARAMSEELEGERLVVGTVGYPNVGKSSVINVLAGHKKVGVASLPGKTKHFQTLNLGQEICLCDCPGLVFPSFANSKAEMMCCGVLPIDQMRDHLSPISLILSRVPKEVLEVMYKIVLPPRDSPKYTTSTFLQVFAAKKGWFTGRALPNEVQAAKVIMKDYTRGGLLHAMLRPDYDPVKHGEIAQSGYNLDMTVLDKPEASAQNYEELKSDASTLMSQTATAQMEEEEKRVPLGDNAQKLSNAQQAQLFNQAEDDFDAQFFKGGAQKAKLNKGEKRVLKFALAQGQDLSQVGDLKSFLNQKLKEQNANKGTKVGAGQQAGKKFARKGNDYRQLEDYTSD